MATLCGKNRVFGVFPRGRARARPFFSGQKKGARFRKKISHDMPWTIYGASRKAATPNFDQNFPSLGKPLVRGGYLANFGPENTQKVDFWRSVQRPSPTPTDPFWTHRDQFWVAPSSQALSLGFLLGSSKAHEAEFSPSFP